mmetsp:Transcript_48356/g.138120  ORF Transcript_48356/g.138120 Transcript_48356/m.138120 type:complete len:449 (+) Transcript_48356:60-1406(+)
MGTCTSGRSQPLLAPGARGRGVSPAAAPSGDPPGLNDTLFNPQVKRWVADSLREADQREDPRVVVIGERGVGKSTLINSLRGLRPGDPGATCVGADEVVTDDQLRGGALYRHAGLLYQDVPGCRGNSVEVGMGSDYIARFRLDTADVCLFVYVSVLNSDIIDCARILQERGVPVYFVRNKVDIDCQNELEDGNAASESQAHEAIRGRAYQQLRALDFEEHADEGHLFLLSAKHAHAVAADPPKYDFSRLKASLVSGIRDQAKQAQVRQIFLKNAKALALCRAQECRRLMSYYVLASAAAGAIPLPGVSQVGDLTIITEACEAFQRCFCLTEAQVSATDIAGIGAYLTLKIATSVPFILAISQAANIVVDGIAWVPVFGIPFSIVVGSSVSSIGMWVALTTILDKMTDVAAAVYDFEMNGSHARSTQELHDMISRVFMGPSGQVNPAAS